MARSRIYLLPGLDGTGQLFDRFLAVAPPAFDCTAITLPSGRLTWDELATAVAPKLSPGSVIVAESFSGPLAVVLANRLRPAGLVFCNSFVVPPRAQALRWLPWAALGRLPVPRPLLRHYLVGPDADRALVDDVAAVVGRLPAELFAWRVRAVLTANVAEMFGRCATPVQYLRGTEDRLVPETAWQHMAALRQMETIRVLGPHLLLQASPAESWQAIERFARSLPAV